MNVEAYITRLLRDITGRWPVERERKYQDRIKLFRAFRESEKDILRPVGWSSETGDRVRDYIVDPLGERIPYVWSDLLFGEDPAIFPARKSDHDRLDDLIDANNLPSELQRAEWLCSSEGEVWWRVVPDLAAEHAMIEWHSRMVVTPLWVGKNLVAVAFISVLDQDKDYIWRYVEIHVKGQVRRMLFRGPTRGDKIGEEVSLASRPETEEWDRDWEHGLDMLAGRIVNKLGGDLHMGVSDFDGVEDLLLALNELTTIGQENARLTAKQRAILPQRFLDFQGNLPRGLEILIATEVDQDPEKIKNQVAMIEFEFDASALIAYTEHLTDRILTRARVAPQLVGRHTEGAQTGPALRARVLDSVLAAQGKGKYWDDEMPRVLLRGAQVEKLSVAAGGLGVAWSNVKDFPSFKRASALPEDPEALSRRLAVEVNSEMLSRKTAIRISHPEWDDTRVEDEVKQIMAEVGNAAPEPGGPASTPAGAPAPPGGAPRTTQPKPRPETSPAKEERRDGAVKARA